MRNRLLAGGDWLLCTLLGALAFLTHFSRFREFGFYEDDFAYVTDGFRSAISPGGFFTYVRLAFQGMPDGRPLQSIFPFALAWLGSRVGGVPALYVLAFLVLWLNSVLMFCVLRRMGSPRTAFVGAVLFFLMPADTTRIFLFHEFVLQASLGFTLAAILLYLDRRPMLSLAASSLVLFTYEAPFFLLFALPVVMRESGISGRWGRAKYAAGLGSILSMYLLGRICSGDGRMGSLSALGAGALIQRVFEAPPIGLFVSAKALLLRSGEGFASFDFGTRFWLALQLCCAGLALSSKQGESAVVQKWRMLALGTAFILASYLTCFLDEHFPPLLDHGRLTSIHYSGSLGWAIVLGILLASPWAHIHRRARELCFVALVACLVSFHGKVAKDFAREWLIQKNFWKTALPMIADAKDGTIIFLDTKDPDLRGGPFIQPLGWQTLIVLEKIFVKPAAWQEMPKVMFLDLVKVLRVRGNRVQIEYLGRSFVVTEDNVILLATNPSLVRLSKKFEVDGHAFRPLAAQGARNLTSLPRTPIYGELVGGN